MKAQFEVDEILWGKVRVAALLRNKTLGELISPLLEGEFGKQAMVGEVLRGRGLKVPGEARKQGSKAPEVIGGGLVGVEPPKPIPAVSVDKQTEGYVEVIRPMAKCRKCGEPFPVADMVTEPKTGKLFCPDCVENMRNNQ